MKKTILTIAASALVALSTVQFAAASEQHRGKAHHRAYTEFRDSNAYASPAYDAAQSGLYRYGGGISAPAGH
jgi:Ni/Co efflux regulator RcnB